MFSRFRKKSGDGGEIVTASDLADALAGGMLADSGIKITPSNALQISTVFACIRVLAESVGMLPLNLMQKTDDNRRQKVTNGSLAGLLVNGPNDFMTPQEFKELIITHLGLRGNHYSYIVGNEGREPLELLPLNPGSVKPDLDNDFNVTYEVTFASGVTETLPANKIFHVKLFSIDGLNGLNPIQWARHTLGLAKTAEKHGSKLFKNAARPAGGFKTEKSLKADQVKELRNQMDAFSGDGAYRNLILQGGLDWFQTTMTNEDAQFLETRKFQRNDICGIFRVPPHMIADLERSTFSNIEHQGLSFVQHSLMPYLTRIEERTKKSLIVESDQYAKFNANALMRGDMKARADFYTKLEQAGALSPNEIREFEDMDPREGGDIYLTPMNMVINGQTTGDQDNGSTNEENT